MLLLLLHCCAAVIPTPTLAGKDIRIALVSVVISPWSRLWIYCSIRQYLYYYFCKGAPYVALYIVVTSLAGPADNDCCLSYVCTGMYATLDEYVHSGTSKQESV